MRWFGSILVSAFALTAANAADPFVVHESTIIDRKAVVATVESLHEIAVRAQIGGTIASLDVKEGDNLAAGARIAEIVDQKIALQIQALDARIAAQQSQRDQAKTDFDRAQALQQRGAGTQTQLDQAKTNFDVAERNLAAVRADRSVVEQQAQEGAVPSPDAGRVLTVPVSVGRVVLPGETIATLAQDHYILRLQLPESHARFLRAGDKVSVGSRGLEDSGAANEREGQVRLVYPEIQGGRVIADVDVPNLGDYFVGERTLAYVDTGSRPAIVVPASYVFRRAGVNYVRLLSGDEVVVQPGATRGASVEILAGLKDGDALVAP